MIWRAWIITFGINNAVKYGIMQKFLSNFFVFFVIKMGKLVKKKHKN